MQNIREINETENRLKKTRKLRYDPNENEQHTALQKSIKIKSLQSCTKSLLNFPTRETSATQ